MRNDFNEVETALSVLVNSGRAKKGQDKGQEFKALISEYKNGFGKNLSSKYIKNLMTFTNDKRKKSKRFSYLMRLSGLKTERQNHYFDDWANQQYKTDIKEFGFNKWNEVCLKDIRLQNVGNFFKTHNKITFYMIRV